MSNQQMDEFREADRFPELKKLNYYYFHCGVSFGVNELIEMLSPVSSQVIWCPSNGEWRFVATLSVDDGKIGIFFPWILPEIEYAHQQKEVSVGLLGDARAIDALHLCQEMAAIFDNKAISEPQNA